MLNYMRNQLQGVVIKSILALVIASFVITIFMTWGMGDKQKNDGSAATVNGKPISIAQFVRDYQFKRQFYQNVYKEGFTPALEKQMNLKQKTMDDLIARHLLLQQAEKEGFSVTDEEVKNRIKAYPAFQENGAFNPAIYKQVLSLNRLNPVQFEEDQRQELLVNKVTTTVRDQVKVSPAEILSEFNLRNEKIKVKYLLFSPELYLNQVTVTDAEVTECFNAHREDYRQPERRKIGYLLLNLTSLEPKEVKAEDIKSYYETNQEKFHKQLEVKASHILLKTTPDTQKETVKIKAEKVLARLKKGEDFAKLAKEFSDDKGSAINGGDLGYFGKGRMVPSFEQAVFSLAKGQMSELVETPYGYHIIKVTDIMQERTLPIEEASAAIERTLKQEGAQAAGDPIAEKIYMQLSEGKLKWQELTGREGWKTKETTLFAYDDMLPEIAPDAAFKQTAFKLVDQEISAPIKINTGYAILRLLETKESYLPELYEVKDKATLAAKLQKSSLMAKEEAGKAAEKFKAGTALNELAKLPEVKESAYFTRQGFIPEIGSIAKSSATLFALDKGQMAAPQEIERGKEIVYTLFFIDNKQAADKEQLKTEEQSLRTQLLSLKQEDRLRAWVDELRKKAEIEINPKILD